MLLPSASTVKVPVTVAFSNTYFPPGLTVEEPAMSSNASTVTSFDPVASVVLDAIVKLLSTVVLSEIVIAVLPVAVVKL